MKWIVFSVCPCSPHSETRHRACGIAVTTGTLHSHHYLSLFLSESTALSLFMKRSPGYPYMTFHMLPLPLHVLYEAPTILSMPNGHFQKKKKTIHRKPLSQCNGVSLEATVSFSGNLNPLTSQDTGIAKAPLHQGLHKAHLVSRQRLMSGQQLGKYF